MEIGNWQATPNLNKAYGEIRRLGLERNVAELEAYGFTVIEPGKAAPIELFDRLGQKIQEVAEKRDGAVDGRSGEFAQKTPIGQLVYHLIWQDQIFEEALMNPVALALITYLLGENCVLQSITGGIKTQTEGLLALHSDNGMIPSPFPPYAQVANATWVLSDYTKENGCLLFVPGSHRNCRHPTPSEEADISSMVPVETPKGSLVIWHGNTWHGAFPKTTTNSIRLNLILLFCRMYMVTQEPLRYEVTPEALARNPPRFAKLMGQHIAYGWRDKGPEWTPVRKQYLGYRTPEARLFD